MSQRNKKIVTLKDVALRTGFTVNTVSRVMNHRDNIAPQTRELILKTAKELGYVGNSLAGSLRSGMSGTVAIIISDVSNPLFGILVKEIDALLRKMDYCAFVLNTNEKEDLEEKAIYLALNKKVDGVIICPTQHTHDALNLFDANGVPYVLMGRCFGTPEENCVTWDDKKGGYLATTHLIRKGHRSILLLNGPQYISSAKERLAGYQQALAEHDIPFDPGLVRQCRLTSQNARALISKQLCDGPKFTAVFAFNDLIAFEAISALNDLGYRVPEDIAVVGFDNIQSKLSLPFPLTTVDTPKTEMAHRAVELLLDRIKDTNRIHEHHILLDTSIVVRQST